MVLLEAQSEGLPVITTYHSGNPDAVINGETGYVVEEGDIHSMVKNIEYIVSDQGRRSEMGRRSRRHISENFSLEKHVAEIEAIYGRVCTVSDPEKIES